MISLYVNMVIIHGNDIGRYREKNLNPVYHFHFIEQVLIHAL